MSLHALAAKVQENIDSTYTFTLLGGHTLPLLREAYGHICDIVGIQRSINIYSLIIDRSVNV